MSRIEIPMDEYQGMKSRIEELEKDLASKDKEIKRLSDSPP
jgi:wobble nucleotide-excising tRNase